MGDWYKTDSSSTLSGGGGADRSTAEPLPFTSRRSSVISRHASVATSQPLATEIGLQLLREGANAAETAVAVAAALCVTEPCSTGLGGDMFCLYYEKKNGCDNDSSSTACTGSTNRVHAINGSGFSPQQLSLELLQATYPDGNGGVDLDKFRTSPHAVTAPGAVRGWQSLLDKFGSHNDEKFSLQRLLEPAVQLAQEGFPVAPITAHYWKAGVPTITRWLNDDDESSAKTTNTPLVPAAGGPEPGQVVQNPDMARVLRDIGRKDDDNAFGGVKRFYLGDTGQAIVDVVQKHGGCLTMADLKHQYEYDRSDDFMQPEPIFVEYRGCRLWQHPPNGQGIAGLIALEGLNRIERQNGQQQQQTTIPGTADSYHRQIELMRMGFADARAFCADPSFAGTTKDTTPQQLLDKQRIHSRVDALFDPGKATIAGLPNVSSGTVSFQVVDTRGNAISFVQSNFMGFGTGLVPKNCGFTLQNRGFGFTVNKNDKNHPNCVAPRKRPYHTIIPGILTHADDTNELYATISNMGGNMQPQGHLQLTVNMLAGEKQNDDTSVTTTNMDPQQAIDFPRFCVADGTQGGVVFLEDGVDEDVVQELQRRGHDIRPYQRGHQRSLFGKAQIIRRDRETGVLWAGSDGRGDGCAVGF